MLTIVMYHYVRNLPRTRFPRIKGLLTENFEAQLEYIARHYAVCGLDQVIAAAQGNGDLPRNTCVLTFDDGLADHYETVLPRLLDRGYIGAFFPSACPVEENSVLDVHKLQFILAAVTDFEALGKELLRKLREYRLRFEIPSDSDLLTRLAVALRYDPPEVAFVKKMLQWALPKQVRSGLTAFLFSKYVTKDETSFAQELYMNLDQLQEMVTQGMTIGGHGYNHIWLGKASRDDQFFEIRKTVSFLTSVLGRPPKKWTMCYPFGSYNAETIGLASEMDCVIGLTTKVGLSVISQPLELQRLDTNDLPAEPNASICEWTKMALR
jgi:peptidoglycan/xylan/chitin deacetylase (PgdA/CDA1 family)